MTTQEVDETTPRRGIGRGREEEGFVEHALTGHVLAAIGEGVGDDLGAIHAQRLDVREPAHDVVVHGLLVREHVARSLLDGRAVHAGLLVEQPDCPDERRPRVRVAGIPLLVPLLRVVAPAMAIERGRLINRHTLAPAEAGRGHRRVERFTRRVEQVRVEAAHLVGVDDEVRVPREHRRDTSA